MCNTEISKAVVTSSITMTITMTRTKLRRQNINKLSKNFEKKPHRREADFSRGECDIDKSGTLYPAARSPAVAVIDFFAV